MKVSTTIPKLDEFFKGGIEDGSKVLVISDMLGLFEDFRPKFVRLYAELAPIIRNAARKFCDDVRDGNFPGKEESYEG